MTARVLVVPAAGLGSRLRADQPKLLVPVGGVPMIDRILHLYAGVVNRAVVIAPPSFEDRVRQHLTDSPSPVSVVSQPRPTGMLDAILLARAAVCSGPAESVWITWCDQIAVRGGTITRLAEVTTAHPETAVVMPTVLMTHPYIHFLRDGQGRITRVLHRREGDHMPETGESDMGLFALSREAFEVLLPRYAEEIEVGRSTKERNFLPFIPWVASSREVITFPATDVMEATGVNTPEDLRAVEAYLRASQPSRS